MIIFLPCISLSKEMIRHPGESFVIFINIRFQKWLGFLLMHLLVSNWLVRFGNNCYDLSRSSLYCCSMYYQTWCLSLFHIKFLNVPNPELRRGFLAVFNRWEGLRKSKYISILQRSWGFYTITYLDHLLLCYATGRIYD